MNGNEYIELAMRTNDGKASDRVVMKLSESISISYRAGKKVQTITQDIGGLLNGCLGLAGEAGETLDIVKKWIFHGKELNPEHLKKEIGDVMWYIAMICYSMGFSLDEIMETNIEKLKNRYPNGFDTQRANNRAPGDI